LSNVVLVGAGDVLNARVGPGVGSQIYVGLLPDVTVDRTGTEQTIDGSVWTEIRTWVEPLWVNTYYLTPLKPQLQLADDTDVGLLLARFAEILANRGDLQPVASKRGIFVSHHSDPVRFKYEDLPGLLKDPTTYQWASSAIGADEMAQAGVPRQTFAEAVADSFVGAYSDADTVTTFNEPITGGNGRIPSAAIPVEFKGFGYVGIHDPGDDPAFSGLDWTTWYVSIDYVDGAPRIVGLTIDQWAP